ncbi:MAG: tetratricopeptide repeat protein [Acidobacteriota bacterium]
MLAWPQLVKSFQQATRHAYKPDDICCVSGVNWPRSTAWASGEVVCSVAPGSDLLSQALALRRRLYDADDPRTAKTLSNLALAHARLADPRAIPLANEALALRRRRLGNDHPQISHALGSLGAAFYGVGRVDEAIDQYRLSIEHGERTLGPDHPSVAYPTSRLGNILLDEGRSQEAEPLLRRAFEIRQATMDDTAPLLRSTRADLERCLRSLGRHAEADDLSPQEPPSQEPLDSRD